MIILESEKKIFNRAIARIRASFNSRSGDLHGIGGSSVGLPLLIAEFDLKESGTDSGAWLRHTEKTLSIGYALRVLQFLNKFVDFAESLVAVGAVDSDSKLETRGVDQYCYCEKKQHREVLRWEDEDVELVYNYYLLWMETQSTAFVFRLSKVESYDNILRINNFSYSAREVSYQEFYSQELLQERFRYVDSRDKGYCGTLKSGCAPEIDHGYLWAGAFNNAFMRLFHNVSE